MFFVFWKIVEEKCVNWGVKIQLRKYLGGSTEGSGKKGVEGELSKTAWKEIVARWALLPGNKWQDERIQPEVVPGED